MIRGQRPLATPTAFRRATLGLRLCFEACENASGRTKRTLDAPDTRSQPPGAGIEMDDALGSREHFQGWRRGLAFGSWPPAPQRLARHHRTSTSQPLAALPIPSALLATPPARHPCTPNLRLVRAPQPPGLLG